jgi:hypothetical protein
MTTSAIVRPKQIRHALMLNLAALLILAPLAFTFDFTYRKGIVALIVEDASVFAWSIGISLLLYGLLLHMIDRGANWARIAFLILFVLSLLSLGLELPQRMTRSLALGLTNIAQLAVMGYVLYLLFSAPCKSWFQPTAVALPVPTGAAATPPAAPRTTLVSVVAWILIVCSAIGLLGALGVVALTHDFAFDPEFKESFAYFIVKSIWSGKPPASVIFALDHVFALCVAVATGLLLVLCASIGLLLRRPWARIIVLAMMALIVLLIAAAFGGLYWSIHTLTLSALPEMAGEQRKLAEAGVRNLWGGHLVLALLCASPFTAVLVGLTRPDVKHDFR